MKGEEGVWIEPKLTSSIAFFIKPFFRFKKVTWRLRASSMRAILILFRPSILFPGWERSLVGEGPDIGATAEGEHGR